MTQLDRIVGGGQQKKSAETLDDILEQQEQQRVRSIKMLDAEALELEKKARVAELRRKIDGGGDSFGSPGGQQNTNSALELVNFFVKKGMDLQKATDFISSLDNETLVKLMMLSGTNRGTESLLPLMMFGGQKGVTAADLVNIGKSYVDAATAKMQNNQAMNFVDFAQAVNALRPPNSGPDPNITALAGKVDTLMTALHERELASARERAEHQSEMKELISSFRESQMQDSMDEMHAKMDELSKRDVVSEIRKAKEVLESAGVTTGSSKNPLEEASDLIDKVIQSPGMNKVFDASADRIRAGGLRGRGGATTVVPPPVGPAQMLGQPILCDNCLSHGQRSVLPITPAVAAGVESVTCSVCGTTYRRGPAGAPPGGGQPPPPPPSPPSPGSRF